MSYLVTKQGDTYQVGEGLSPVACFRCGICCICYRPKLGGDEIAIIANKLGMSHEIFRNKFVRVWTNPDKPVLDDGGKQCPFLARDRIGKSECTIYPFRPRACGSWQASLSRVECREGLSKLKPKTGIILPQDIYQSPEEINDLYSNIR